MSMMKRHLETIAAHMKETNHGLFMDAYDFVCDFGDEGDVDGFLAYTDNTSDWHEALAALMAAGDHIAREVAPLDSDSAMQQAWWDSMTAEQREDYEDAIARRAAEIEVYGRELTQVERERVLSA